MYIYIYISKHQSPWRLLVSTEIVVAVRQGATLKPHSGAAGTFSTRCSMQVVWHVHVTVVGKTKWGKQNWY